MLSKIKYKIILLCITVAVSGCAQVTESSKSDAQLLGKVSDEKITDSGPGEIKLNAVNNRNSTDFRVEVRPVGDYSNIARVTDRQGEELTEVDLGTAVKDATTGQKYVEVRKRLNVTSSVKIKAELYNSTGEQILDSRIYNLRSLEN